MKNRNVRAIVSYEPGSNFPSRKVKGRQQAPAVAASRRLLSSEIPIMIYYGDNIPRSRPRSGAEQWRVFLAWPAVA